ncbi:hypothetical protein M758_6G024700 [Ceratodon purpureus]|nr:hypothetical protein M758_6G024700 [Ceratodon purpureus]
MQEIPYDASHVPIDYDDPTDVEKAVVKTARKDGKRERREQRAALEKDVAQLQKKLMIEVNMRNALNRGLSRPLGSLPKIYGCLPVETRELLLEVAVLEEEIISLEKQVVHLGREIENEAPATDKETICQTPHKILSPVKTGVLGSPLLSPKASARINSKPLASPRKSPDPKSNLSKPSLSIGKVTENKSSPSKISISPRNSLDNGSSVKSPTTLKESSKPTCISTIGAPQKSQIQRNRVLPKVPARNSRDFKSRKLSFTRREPHGDNSMSPLNTVPFIPMNLSLPKESNESTPPVSPASGGPSDIKKGLPGKPPRIETENGKPLMTGPAPLRKKDPINIKNAPAARSLKAPSANKQDKDPVDLARRTPRLPRQPAKLGTISTRRTVGASAASRKQRMDTHKTSAPKARTTSDLNCDSNPQLDHQRHVDAGAGEHISNNIKSTPPTAMLDGDQISVYHAKESTPEADTKSSLEQAPDSVLLSEEVVKLLETIYENMQEKQPPLAYDSASSSQASMSASISSASPDDYDIKGGANREFRLDGCHTESFRVKRSASMKLMRDCYPGELADTMDPFSYLSRGNISNRIEYHERLMS